MTDVINCSSIQVSKKSDTNENTEKNEPKVCSISLNTPSKISNDSSTGSPKIKRKAPKLPVPRQFKTRSLVVPECVNLGGGEENKGFLPASFGEGYWPSVQDGHFVSIFGNRCSNGKLLSGRSIFFIFCDVL